MTKEPDGRKVKRACPECGREKAAVAFSRHDARGRCRSCVNRAPDTPEWQCGGPCIDVPLTGDRIVRLRIFGSLVALSVGSVVERCVRQRVTLGGDHATTWRVASTSEAFAPVSTITFPLRAVAEVRRALVKAERGTRPRGRERK